MEDESPQVVIEEYGAGSHFEEAFGGGNNKKNDMIDDAESEEYEEEDPFDELFTEEQAYKPELDKDEGFNKARNMDHRGTFVGTPLYATPEMLNSSISGPFTDLWALGVIAYQIIAGETPWKGLEYAVFQ